jgi:hypothetical protein
MHNLTKILGLFLIISALILTTSSFPVLAQDPLPPPDIGDPYGAMAADLVLARPLGFVATVLGTALFIVSLPFSAAGGNSKEAFERLVEDPAKFTFTRPLGRWQEEEDYY